MDGPQLYHSTERCVDVMLQAMAATNTAMQLVPQHRLLVDKRWLGRVPTSVKKVAVVSGGGSGHEPFSAGYIGEGMLAASVAGHVFTSPPPTDISAAITAVGKDNTAGVLVIVFNYTGDRLNFGLAVERCRATGMKVDMHISGDDSALTEVEGTAGRRGLCGTLFIFKIAGAMAEQGATLEQIVATCKLLSGATGTIGVAAGGCRLPGATHPLMTVQEGRMELGLGVHGEPGAATLKAGTLQDTVSAMLTQLTSPASSTHLALPPGARVCVMVNNLGGLTVLEVTNIIHEVITQLAKRQVTVARIYQGPLMTSLDMRGAHISLLKLQEGSRWLELLDYPTTAPAWPKPYLWCGRGTEDGATDAEGNVKLVPDLLVPAVFEDGGNEYTLTQDESRMLRLCLSSVLEGMSQHESHLNHLDAKCGDGDCGSTFIEGVKGLSDKLDTLDIDKPGRVFKAIGEVTAKCMGGTSGGVYSIFFTAASGYLTTSSASGSRETHSQRWAKALRAGTDAITKYGGAEPGDRTLLDAMVPAIEVLEACTSTLQQSTPCNIHNLLCNMAIAADNGAKKTATMKARAGRATYVRAEKVQDEDAGARCVAMVLQCLASAVQPRTG